jgi:hypothetical protein
VSILSVTDQLQHRDLIAELAAGGLIWVLCEFQPPELGPHC